jgi:hypothetical protein
MQRRALTVFAYLLLAILLTWPAAQQLGTAVPGADRTDTWNSLWSLNHWATALKSGNIPWLVDSLNFPEGGVLLVSDPLGATIAFPLVLIWGAPVAFTVLVLFQLTLAGSAMHFFAAEFLVWRRGTGQEGFGPWVSGVSFTVAPLLMSHIHNGASESWSAGWTVLAVWAVWRAAIDPSNKRIIWGGIALALASLAHWYGGIVAFIFASMIALFGVGGSSSGPKFRVWLSWGLGLILVGLLAWGSSALNQSEDSIVQIKDNASVQFTTRTTGAADPLTYVLPGDFRSPDFRKVSANNEQFMHVHYLGFVALGLGVWGWIRRPRNTRFLVAGGLVCFLLSLGPVLVHNARAVILFGDLAIPLPFYLLEGLPGFVALSLPWKFALGPVIALALLSGLALDLRGRRLCLIAIAAMCLESRVLSPAAEIPALAEVVDDPVLAGLRAAPKGAVMNYPLPPGRQYLAEQIIHEKPIAGTLNHVANRQAMRLWGRIRAESKRDPDTFHRTVSSTAKRLGIRYLVIHTDPDAEPDVYSSAVYELERLFGVPDWGRGQTRVVPLW